MSKELFIVLAIVAVMILLSIPAYAGQVWILVDSQYSGREWYCTYQLSGTEITSQVVSSTPCEPSMFR